MPQRTLFIFIFLAGALSACTHAKIYDDPWCADAGAHGAYCFNTLSKHRYFLNKYQWDKLRPGQICTATEKPGEGYKHIKVPLEQLCANTNLCSPGDQELLKSVSGEADQVIDAGAGSPPFSGETNGH